MTPIKLEILLHYYYAYELHPNSETPAARDAIVYLIASDLLIEGGDDQPFDVTERGVAYIKHLLTIPFPVKQWIIP